MTLQELTAKMKEGASKKSAFGNTVKFSTDQGVVYIDGTQNPPAVTNDDKAADCTIKMDFGDFTDMIGGKLDGMTAFMTGKLKIEGDMGVAMKLQSILRSRLLSGLARVARARRPRAARCGGARPGVSAISASVIDILRCGCSHCLLLDIESPAGQGRRDRHD
jgi:putative sterol carrier protein